MYANNGCRCGGYGCRHRRVANGGCWALGCSHSSGGYMLKGADAVGGGKEAGDNKWGSQQVKRGKQATHRSKNTASLQ